MSSSPQHEPRYCGKCGVPSFVPDDLFCRKCGARLAVRSVADGLDDHPNGIPIARSSASVVATAPRQRPIWLVSLLTFCTLGLYLVVWAGLSWAEIKRERNDPRMHPFWHSLTLVVPVYNLFRIHAHFRAIQELRAQQALPPVIAPAIAVICWALANGVDSQVSRVDTFSVPLGIAMDFLGSLLCLVVVVGGQMALNGYWQSWRAEGREIPERRANWAEWTTMILGGVFVMLVVIGVFVS